MTLARYYNFLKYNNILNIRWCIHNQKSYALVAEFLLSVYEISEGEVAFEVADAGVFVDVNGFDSHF